MIRSLLSLVVLAVLSSTIIEFRSQAVYGDEKISIASTDWPWWRGPNRNGIAAEDQNPPVNWSDSENILWSVNVPGRGHGSPTVVGRCVYLATAEHQSQIQSVICYDRVTGKQLWKSVVHEGGFPKKSNKKASLASSSVACDGERLFICFFNDGAVHATALDLRGKIIWRCRLTDYVIHQGFSSSPAVYKSLVLYSADSKKVGGVIAGLDRKSGRIVWRHDRPKMPNYVSPIVLRCAGKDQLVFTGCEKVSSYDPLSGEKNWEVKGATTECVTSVVTDGTRVFSSGGYPKNHVAAIKADGSGEAVWENKSRVYVPSMVIQNGYIFAVLDAGVAACWESSTGKEMWKKRLGGTFSSSPIIVGDKVFATNENGKTYIFRANPKTFEMVGENQLGDNVLATPAYCHNQIFTRIARQINGQRQESLVCIGAK